LGLTFVTVMLSAASLAEPLIAPTGIAATGQLAASPATGQLASPGTARRSTAAQAVVAAAAAPSPSERPRPGSSTAPTGTPATLKPSVTAPPAAAQAAPPTAVSTPQDFWTVTRVASPAGTEVRDAAGAVLARFTDGAFTVSIAGPRRSFSEVGLAVTVVTNWWVRVLPQPFGGVMNDGLRSWLAAALTDRSPDVLATAVAYTSGTQADARYAFGADFNDYLGITSIYGNTVVAPKPANLGALDCSGFVRLVFGYRSGVPLSLSVSPGRLPRQAMDQLAGGPGRVVATSSAQVTAIGSLRPGDLVFFDASTADGTAVDHVGIYLGVDTQGHRRFVSSRRSADGPTFGDVSGASTIDGTGYWARAFRGIRRV
jgi:cell wall-associated NlpC family hydrolase